MTDFDYKEKRFEQDIEESLTTKGGYVKWDPSSFDRILALDKSAFINFIKNRQPKQWERFEKIYVADSEKQIIERFWREVRRGGRLKDFRQGFIGWYNLWFDNVYDVFRGLGPEEIFKI